MAADDFYKREEDRKWRESVDRSIVQHTTSLKVLHDMLNEIRGELNELDEIISGSALAGTDGIAHHVNTMQRTLEKLDRIVCVGDVLKGALTKRMDKLEDQKAEKQSRFKVWLKFWGPIVVAAIGALALILKAWPEIKPFFVADDRSAYERLTQPKPRKKVKRRAPKPPQESTETINETPKTEAE